MRLYKAFVVYPPCSRHLKKVLRHVHEITERLRNEGIKAKNETQYCNTANVEDIGLVKCSKTNVTTVIKIKQQSMTTKLCRCLSDVYSSNSTWTRSVQMVVKVS